MQSRANMGERVGYERSGTGYDPDAVGYELQGRDTAPKGKRIRGRLGIVMRKRRLEAEPLCRDCKEQGIIRPAEEVDHILPLAHGGSDDDANCRALCRKCHHARTAESFGYRRKVEIGHDGWPKC